MCRTDRVEREEGTTTHQFAIQPTRIAVELVVESATPKRGVCRTAVRALALDAPGCRVAGVVRTVVVARRWGGRWALASSSLGCRQTSRRVCGARRRSGSGNRRRAHDLVFTHGGKTGGNRVHVGGLNGHRGGPFRRRGRWLDGLLLALLLSLGLVESLHLHVHRHGVGLGHRGRSGSVHSPLIGFTLEEFVDRELEGGAGYGKAGGWRLVRLEGKRGLAVGHAHRSSRGRAQKGGRTEIGGKNGGKAELLGGAGGRVVTRANIVRDVHGSRIVMLVLVFVGVLVGPGTVGGSDPHGVVFAVLGGVGERLEGLHVGIECKGILHRPHAVLGVGSKWLSVLAVALHLLNTGTDLFRRVCAFKIGGLELGNGPG